MASNQSADAELPGVLRAELRALLARGAQMGAIERYRAATGADLASATDVIDRFARSDGQRLRGTSFADWLKRLAVFCCLSALVAALASAWQAHERSVVRNSWPLIDAEVIKCRIDEIMPAHLRAAAYSSLGCRFRYRVAGVQYTASTHSTSLASPQRVAAMRQWMAQHRPGTHQAIHYDPSMPQSISLGEADLAFEADTPALRLRVAGILAGAGILFFAVAIVFAARRR